MGNIAEDTQWLDATDQAALIASGEVSAAEMVDGAAERIDRIDGDLNAVVMRWYDRARRQAAMIDDAWADGGAGDADWGPFAGVPFLLKDLGAHDAGMPMTSGNRAMRAAQPISERDMTIVTRFRDAGLITLGRTNSPELGSLPVTEPMAYGPTRSPWDTDRTPGGSSGGAAAAVASGMVSVAHASDGGGSIRIPASCCGLVGLKTSQGRITMGPYANESGLSVSFCVSRSVRDSARLLDAVQGPGVGDTVIAAAPTRPYIDEVGSNPGRLRIGLLDTHPLGNALHDDCITAVRSAAAMLEGLGHDVSPGHPPALEDASFTPRFMAMWSTMMAVSIDAMGESIGRELTEDDVEPVNWALARHADDTTSVEYAEALAAVVEYRRSLQQWWEGGWDLLLTPTLCEPPVKIGEHDSTPGDPMAGMKRAGDFIAFTPPFNASGQPAINLPLHWNDDGLPIGVQLVAAYGREDLLLAVASQLEAAHPWADRRPSVC
ncbi:MAG: amidase [Actinobacteria bacterium]|nr:amidase [Actinomycetota bacterium]